MRNALKSNWLFILLLLGLSAFYFRGLSKVPFHPDESTQLYMSADFEQILTNPLIMAWEENASVSSITRYRLLDAPLTRYLLGFGRTLFSEVGNYRENTKAAESLYLHSPTHQLWRNSTSGIVLFGLTILGVAVAVRASIQSENQKHRLLVLYLFSFLALAAGFITMIPLPWQRYSISFIPITNIFISFGLVWLIKNSRRIYSHGRLSARLSQVLAQLAPDSWMS